MQYERRYLKTLKDRISSPRLNIQVLTGPRQTGKTTIVKQLTEQIHIPFLYVSADNVANATNLWVEQQWETARIKLKISGVNEFILVIDEIQKIKNWSEAVKALWDEDTFNNINLKVILLGSSGLMLQEGLNESLAGRFESIKIPHWSFNEMKECFGLTAEQYVWFGGYPGTAGFIDDENRWKEYVKYSLIEATISKDIFMLTRIVKPALLRQVFEMGITYSGQILSFNKMLGQLQEGGNTTTISHYLHLLDVAGLLAGIPKYYDQKYREKASTPKWQAKNTALISAVSEMNFYDIRTDPVKWGRMVESAVGAHLINKADEGSYRVFYWRHRNEEVDFVLQKGHMLIGIEVKSGYAKHTKGMAGFKTKFSPVKMLLVGFSGLRWQEFLTINPGDLF